MNVETEICQAQTDLESTHPIQIQKEQFNGEQERTGRTNYVTCAILKDQSALFQFSWQICDVQVEQEI